ncbi:alpha/beta hydrolase [Martelella limonii]|uniref:alpha/beta hydrolase n=1 Tax=Martelella limonii TaxID=1647649 RepID=UPI0015809E39|nr:alpha/beta hydrolase [Martelella limonii]
MDYTTRLDPDILAFVDATNAFYPADLRPDDWGRQRQIYDRMCAEYHAGRPPGLKVEDRTIAGVRVRLYGAESDVVVLYAHGGGFVLGGLESHDDVCAELAVAAGVQLVAVDYRLVPEHAHPAAYDDVMAVARALSEDHALVLSGDSAGGSLCASVAGTWQGARPLAGQVLIYPSLGYFPEGGSYETHANAPLLTRDEVKTYGLLRGGAMDDPRAMPSAGDLTRLPPTVLFAAECDPMHDDCLRYQAAAEGADVTVHTHEGLVHGWLRARHRSKRAGAAFAEIADALSDLCRQAR